MQLLHHAILEKKYFHREDNIKMDLREIVIYGTNWIQLAQSPVAGFCEHGSEPSGSIRKQDIFDKLSDNKLFK
jgi:hypothetical protein